MLCTMQLSSDVVEAHAMAAKLVWSIVEVSY